MKTIRFALTCMLSAFALCTLAQTMTNTLPITGGGSCVQTLSCAGGGVTPPPVVPQCPSPPGIGPCGVTPPPTPGNIVCPGFTKTIVMAMDWANPTRLYTSQNGNFGPNDALVVTFTTGNGTSAQNSLPRIVVAEYQSSPSTRIAVLSATPCDWSAQDTQGATTSGTTVTIPFTVNNSFNYAYYPILKLNTTYYLNLKNAPSSSCTASGACDVAVDLNKPGGLAFAMSMVPTTITPAVLAADKAKSKAARAMLDKAARVMKAKAAK